MCLGHLINELHPPLKVTVSRITKVRRIPNHSGEVVRRVNTDASLVALGTTPDFVWLQVGPSEFILTRDCKLEEQKSDRKVEVIALAPPLPLHVKEEVTVRKMPSVNGKAVGLLEAGDMVTAVGATPDYAWLKIGHKQYIPSVFAKLGDPTTPLNPAVTVHVIADSAKVRDIPSYEGAVVTALARGDVFEAVAVSADMKWLKIAKNNYIPAAAVKVGLPPPTTVTFPEPITVKLAEQASVVKNPSEPQYVLRTLEQGDEVLAIGTTSDFKWLQLAHKRFIPIQSARLQSAIPDALPLSPAVPIKLATDTPVRHIPDTRGRVMAILKKGDHADAVGVSADFSWLQLGENMYVPLASTFFRKADPVMNPVVPPMSIKLRKDAEVYKRPEDGAKVVRVAPLGDALQATAASPDLEWIKVGEKEYIKADAAVAYDAPELSPLSPPVKVVVIRDTKVFKAPAADTMVVRRIKRGETLKSAAVTADMQWLQLSANEYIKVEDVAHVATTSPLRPAVKVVVASSIKARNVPAFSGRAVKTLQRHEVVLAQEVTRDYKWFKIGKHMYIPAAACVPHESEGKNLVLIVKARNTPTAPQPAASQVVHPAVRPVAPPTADRLAAKVSAVTEIQEETNEEKVRRLQQNIMNQHAVNPKMSMERVPAISNVFLARTTPVYSKPDVDAEKVRELPRGTAVTVSAMDRRARWLQIGQDQYIEAANTGRVF